MRVSLALVLPIVLLSTLNDFIAGRYTIAFLGPLGYSVVILVALWRRPRLQVRAMVLIITGYTVGVILLRRDGFVGSGGMLLLMAAIFGAMMLRRRNALLLAALYTGTLLLIIAGLASGLLTLEPALALRLSEPTLLIVNGLLLIY
ncbi:MAG: hypothetical protein HGA45_44695, partial [Chloroflexales bacterium]|nr:hypothetical protein [Chloroflexales bacterium]